MKKVLVVEDEYILALVQVKFLQKKGYDVVASVPDGTSAIEAVKKFCPDLIIMDVRLQGELDGVETMEEIRKFSSVPVIFCSGNSEVSVMERAKATVMAGFIVKPVNFDELEVLIRTL